MILRVRKKRNRKRLTVQLDYKSIEEAETFKDRGSVDKAITEIINIYGR